MSETQKESQLSPLARAMMDVDPDFLATAKGLAASTWSAFGIHTPYTFMITGRCGSTWLAHLLGSSGASNTPHEFFSEDGFAYYAGQVGAGDIRAYVGGLAQSFGRNGVFGFQITPGRLAWLHEIISNSEFLLPAQYVWIDLRRLNIVAQAFSFWRARTSGMWHRYTDESSAVALDASAITSDYDIWREIIFILAQERAIDSFYNAHGVAPLRHFYEEVVEDKLSVLVSILGHLRIDANAHLSAIRSAADRTEKLKRPEEAVAELSFQARYAECLDRLRRNRQTLNVKEFVDHSVLPALRRVDPSTPKLTVPLIRLPTPANMPANSTAEEPSRLASLRRAVYFCTRTIFEPRTSDSLERLRQELGPLVDIVPDELPIALLRAQLAIVGKQPVVAETELRALVEILPDSPLPYKPLIELIRRLGRVEEANELQRMYDTRFPREI